jgi:hypothetical protein
VLKKEVMNMFTKANEIASLTKKFNEINKQQKGSRSYCQIVGFEEFDKKENGATCAIHFHESIHGMERNSKFEFLDENHIVQYLKAHT